MQEQVKAPPGVRWIKGTGAKPPATETRPVDLDKLQIEGRTRDLAMFNLVIDTSQL